MLRKRDASAVKRERMQQMHRMLCTGDKVDYTRFLASCSYAIGLTHKTTKKYLKDLETIGLIEVNEEEGWIVEVKPKEAEGNE